MLSLFLFVSPLLIGNWVGRDWGNGRLQVWILNPEWLQSFVLRLCSFVLPLFSFMLPPFTPSWDPYCGKASLYECEPKNSSVCVLRLCLIMFSLFSFVHLPFWKNECAGAEGVVAPFSNLESKMVAIIFALFVFIRVSLYFHFCLLLSPPPTGSILWGSFRLWVWTPKKCLRRLCFVCVSLYFHHFHLVRLEDEEIVAFTFENWTQNSRNRLCFHYLCLFSLFLVGNG